MKCVHGSSARSEREDDPAGYASVDPECELRNAGGARVGHRKASDEGRGVYNSWGKTLEGGMVVQRRIEEKLAARLCPSVLIVENESKNHGVPPGSETHFKVTVVSSAFVGLERVDRQRLVHSVLAEELAGGVHALTMTSRTPAEWAEDSAVRASPACLGGSKSDA
jgi:BolA protein